MLPTLNAHGDVLLQEAISLKRSPPRLDRGDLVISVSPVDPTRLVCKRLLGLPGDTICVDPTESAIKHVEVPRGHVWLQGDNYNNSRDSRLYGPVPMGLLRARVVARASESSFEKTDIYLNALCRYGH
jgi:inner membrane protease subunit 1